MEYKLGSRSEELFGKKMKCSEMLCIAKGDPYREFTLTPEPECSVKP
ncbi:MAG: hypothetical protein RMJ00_00340 [Nitrososphaerota archaeon]|nr:hypothetical protein [Candidatus Bathyarchaeota archaeon]MCX8162617.1 hypothetical protein [Candidatus Bathyarchaeota archaeon]MDW8061139.1 hypothetical protein [Nitrososphaerota archaeon]